MWSMIRLRSSIVPFAELFEGYGGRFDRLVYIVKDSKAAAAAVTIRNVRACTKLLEHLFDDAFDDLFGGLHE